MATPTNSNRNINIAVIAWPVVYLAVLVALPIIRNEYGSSLPHYVLYPLQSMPLSVLWFGALGGVMVSLYGIFVNRAWQNQFNLWHAFSGLLGAIYGLISYLIIVVLINSITINNHFDRNALAYDLIAFIFGFSQHALGDTLRRLTGLVFGKERTDLDN